MKTDKFITENKIKHPAVDYSNYETEEQFKCDSCKQHTFGDMYQLIDLSNEKNYNICHTCAYEFANGEECI